MDSRKESTTATLPDQHNSLHQSKSYHIQIQLSPYFMKFFTANDGFSETIAEINESQRVRTQYQHSTTMPQGTSQKRRHEDYKS